MGQPRPPSVSPSPSLSHSASSPLFLLLLFSLSIIPSLSTFSGNGWHQESCTDPAQCSSWSSDEVAYLQSIVKLRSESTPSLGRRQTLQHGDVPLASAEGQTARLDIARPAYWLHVPKCGTSFLNALLYLPGMCPNLPDGFMWKVTPLESLDAVLDSWCPGSFAPLPEQYAFAGHSGVGGIYQSLVKGHNFVMLRQPEQRIISAFKMDQHSWPFWHFGRWATDLLEYAHVISGCAVRMLTREGATTGRGNDAPTPCGGPVPATAAEITLARQRLREGSAFVGLTDEWDLSICLLHAVFGGKCLSSDFLNVRPGGNATDLYDTSELMGYKDLADGSLYEEAFAVFSEQMQRYGVTSESCQPCFQQGTSSD